MAEEGFVLLWLVILSIITARGLSEEGFVLLWLAILSIITARGLSEEGHRQNSSNTTPSKQFQNLTDRHIQLDEQRCYKE